MSPLKQFAIAAGFLLALVVGFLAGQDFSKFSAEWNRCIAYGGDGLTVGDRMCFKRVAVAVPNL